MSINSTLPNPGDTPGPGSSTGLIVGLTLFFLLVIVVMAAIMYKFQSRLRDMLQSVRRRAGGGGGEGGRRGSQKSKNSPETKDNQQHYTSLIREQDTVAAAAHSPIYENYSKSGYGGEQGGNHGSSPGDPEEEDVYLQCDSADNAIYGNDPDCRLVITSQEEEEDIYIIPDS